MKIQYKYCFYSFFLIFSSFDPFCSVKKENKITRLVYRFSDSSVPPKYHRSYTIEITDKKVSMLIDSYGTVLVNKSFPSTAETLERIVECLKKCEMRNGIQHKITVGCTVGTSESVFLYLRTKEVFQSYVYFCGGERTGTLYGDIKNFSKCCCGFVPGFSDLLNISYTAE